MNIEEETFLREVAVRSKDPVMMQNIILAAIRGLQIKAKEVREHAVDMETVASMALNTRLFKGNETFIADKLEKWKHMNSNRWDAQIERLREKAK